MHAAGEGLGLRDGVMGTSAGLPDQHSRKDGEARDPHAVAQMHLGDDLAVHWARLITRSRSGAATRFPSPSLYIRSIIFSCIFLG